MPNVSIKSEVLGVETVVTGFNGLFGSPLSFTHSDALRSGRLGRNVKLH